MVFVGWAESEGVAVQDGSQLGQAPVLEQAWVARELFNEGIQHLLGMSAAPTMSDWETRCACSIAKRWAAAAATRRA